MPAKGTTAKENVAKKIQQAFGADYVGEFDKKLYVWADDGGTRVQIAIALTAAKIQRGVEDTAQAPLNFEDDAPAVTSFKPAEVTKEETDTLAALMAKLGL